MERPDAAVLEEEEKKDGVENEEGQENDNLEHQPAGDENIDGDGKDGADGKAGEKDEGEAEPEEEAELDPRDAKIAALEADIKAIKEGGPKPAAATAAPPAKVYTEEEKAQIAERFGVQDFRTVEAFGGMVANAVMSIRQEMQGMMSQFQKDAVIGVLSKQKEYSDIMKYREGIDKYLAKFSPQYHGNEEFIKDGLAWAKGQGLRKTVAKALNNGDKNRRIAGPARPASAGGGDRAKGGGFKFKLTAAEESAYASFGKQHFKTREDYAKSLKRYKNA